MLTYTFANQVLNLLTGRSTSLSIAGLGTVYVGLSSTAPDRDSTNVTEPDATTGYQRVLLGNTSQNLTQLMSNSTAGETANTKAVFFPKALTDYDVQVTHFLLYINNVLVAYEPLKTAITPLENTVPIIDIGDLELSLE